MKKTLLMSVAILIFGTVSVVSVKVNKNKMNVNDLVLANIEALAQFELYPPFTPPNNSPYGKAAKTEGCVLQLGGGFFTGSVKKVCVERNDCPMCVCTPVPCGEVFYVTE